MYYKAKDVCAKREIQDDETFMSVCGSEKYFVSRYYRPFGVSQTLIRHVSFKLAKETLMSVYGTEEYLVCSDYKIIDVSQTLVRHMNFKMTKETFMSIYGTEEYL